MEAKWHELLQSSVATLVCSFLSARDLSSAELAGCDRYAVATCWHALREAIEARLTALPWSPMPWVELPRQPKPALLELSRRLRAIVDVPASWAPWIQRVSPERIRVLPGPCQPAGRQVVQDGGGEDHPDRQAGAASGQRPVPPKLVAVPLSCGGMPCAVGIRLSCPRLCGVGEACLLAADWAGVLYGHAAMTMVSFAPVTGRCLVQFPGDSTGLASQPLPPIEGSVPAGAESEELEAFLLVSASGGISFGRRHGAKARTEWSGELPRELFPAWSSEVSTSLNFQILQLREPVQVSVSWVDFGFPEIMAGTASIHAFSGEWSVHEWW